MDNILTDGLELENIPFYQAQYGGDCNLCREGAREVRKRLQTASQEETEDKMLELCGYMGSFSTACMETVLDQSTVRFVKNYSSFQVINS